MASRDAIASDTLDLVGSEGVAAALVERVQADVTAPATLERAVNGVDVVISAVATARPIGSNRPERVDYEGTLNLARAARAAGVRMGPCVKPMNSAGNV